MNKNTLIVKLLAVIFILNGCAPQATKSFRSGVKRFEQAEYQFAIENFKQSLAKGGPQAESNFYIAESYRRSNRVHESEAYYAKAIEANTNEEEAYFWYGFALKSNGNYEGAFKQLSDYLKLGTNFDLINRAKNEIENLKILNDIVAKKSYYEIKNIDKLNSPEAEYSPVFYNDKLYFTTSRGAEKMHAATGTGFTDIYEYIFDGSDYFSGQAKRMPESINTNDAHEACPVFTKDGKTMIFSRGNTGNKKGAKDVNLYISRKDENGNWTEPQIMSISDPNAWDSSPALSADGKTLYFASNRESGSASGGVDLYKATLNADGEWGNVVNLGSPINTRGNDMFPYEDALGNFYFSSDGHPSLGALDIFVVRKEGGKLRIENLGKPINTSFDDFGISYKDSITGFIASNRPGGKGDDDVYEFLDKSKIKIAHYMLDGFSYTKEEGREGEISLAGVTIKVISEKGDTLTAISSDGSGKFTYEVEPETRYRIRASKEGFLTEEKDFSTLGTKVPYAKLEPGESYFKIPFKIELPKKAVGVTIVIDNIYYDFNKWDIRPDAAIELYKIVELMNNNPDIKIELSSHTDERGNADYNKKLSQRRAQSAVDYIISKGIAKDRITAKGYGKEKPIIKNAQTEDDHQTNRRTEFTITGLSDPNIKIEQKGAN